MSADAHTIPTPQATYAQRVAFVSEIAGRLHSYGTTAQRLETAVVALARQLDLDCEPWSNPTGIILSFSDPAQAIGSSDITRVIRLSDEQRVEEIARMLGGSRVSGTAREHASQLVAEAQKVARKPAQARGKSRPAARSA